MIRRLLTDRDAFELRILLPLCALGASVLPILIYLGVLR